MVTMGTFIGFLPCTNSYMLLQTARLSKSFWTMRTGVGLLSSVTNQMSSQSMWLREWLFTLRAAIGFLFQMHLQMEPQCRCTWKRLGALVFSLVLTPKCGFWPRSSCRVSCQYFHKFLQNVWFSKKQSARTGDWKYEKQSRANKRVVWIFFFGCICMCFHWMLKATKKKFFSKNSWKKNLLSMSFKI